MLAFSVAILFISICGFVREVESNIEFDTYVAKSVHSCLPQIRLVLNLVQYNTIHPRCLWQHWKTCLEDSSEYNTTGFHMSLNLLPCSKKTLHMRHQMATFTILSHTFFKINLTFNIFHLARSIYGCDHDKLWVSDL